MNQPSDELLPCPHCGSKAKLFGHDGDCLIECINPHCGGQAELLIGTVAATIKIWNTRTITPAELKRLVDGYKESVEGEYIEHMGKYGNALHITKNQAEKEHLEDQLTFITEIQERLK